MVDRAATSEFLNCTKQTLENVVFTLQTFGTEKFFAPLARHHVSVGLLVSDKAWSFSYVEDFHAEAR